MPTGHETVIEAALRELDEEMGLKREADDVLGLLDDYPTRSGYLITPVVVWGGHDPVLTPNPKEVARVYHIKLADIAPSEADRGSSGRSALRPEWSSAQMPWTPTLGGSSSPQLWPWLSRRRRGYGTS